jgi:hypothetical protein
VKKKLLKLRKTNRSLIVRGHGLDGATSPRRPLT